MALELLISGFWKIRIYLKSRNTAVMNDKFDRPKYVWLMGGFGNILFQILGFNVLKKQGYRNVYFINTLVERNVVTQLMKWKIHQPIYRDLISPSEFGNVSNCYALFCTLLAFFSKETKFQLGFANFYKDKYYFTQDISRNIFSYFQDKFFLSENKNEVTHFANELSSIYRRNQSYDVVVHYRKGDSGWLVNGYYEKVRDLLKKESNLITVVTDSPRDALVFFSGINNLTISDGKNALEDFSIMLSARKLYCAPSTFSWWAAHGLSYDSSAVFPRILDEKMGIYVKCKYELI